MVNTFFHIQGKLKAISISQSIKKTQIFYFCSKLAFISEGVGKDQI